MVPEDPSKPEAQNSENNSDTPPEAPTVQDETVQQLKDSSELANEIAAIESPNAEPPAPVVATPDPHGVIEKPWLKEEKPKSSRKWLFVGIIVAVVLSLFSGSGYAAYALWYQNPDKVVMDGFISAVSAKTSKFSGSATAEYSDFTARFDFDSDGGLKEGNTGSGTVTLTSKKYNVDFKLSGESVVASNGDAYFRIKDLPSVYQKALDDVVETQANMATQEGQKVTPQVKAQLRQTYDSFLGGIIKKIGTKWIKISIDDTKSFDKEAGDAYECTQRVTKHFVEDQKQIQEVMNAYDKNKFIVIKEKLGTKNGSVGYVVDVDMSTAKFFAEDIKSTTVYKDLKACDEESVSFIDSIKDFKPEDSKVTTRVEIWANEWSHQFTGMKLTAEGGDDTKIKLDVDVTTSFNQPVTITIPKDVITLDQLKSEVESLYSGYSESLYEKG